MYQLRVIKCNNRRQVINWDNIINIPTNMPACPFKKGDNMAYIDSWFKDEILKVDGFLELELSYYHVSVFDMSIGEKGRTIYFKKLKNVK